MVAVEAMSRFLNHGDVTLPALIEPVQEAVRDALRTSPATVALVVHGRSLFSFRTHSGKLDRYRRTHDRDLDAGPPPPGQPPQLRIAADSINRGYTNAASERG